MNAFDAAWLLQHQTKMAALRGKPVKPPPLLVEFSIPHALKLPNTTGGRCWIAGYGYRKRLLPMVADAVKPWAGHACMERARVTIVRHSVGMPDPGAVMAAVKPLVDLLLVKSETHPHSLGLIRDDSPAHIELIATGAKVARRSEQRTDVRLERLT